MHRISRAALATTVLTLASIAACGGGGSSSSSTPNEPSAPSTSVNLSGSWRGAASDSSGPGEIALQVTQTGTALSGSASITLTGSPVTGRGTMSGTLSGSTVHLTITVPAGGFDAPYGSCNASVTGDGQASATSITATYTGTNSCSGNVASGQMSLSKQ
jgi:hypothetical protein